MLEHFVLFIVSTIANTMSAFAGGGAGLVQLPAILLLGLPFPIALATHKCVTVALGLGAYLRIRKEGNLLETQFALFALLCGMLGAVLGVFVIVQVPEDTARTALSLLILCLAVYACFKRDMGQSYAPKNRDAKGLAIGGLGLFGVGFLNGTLASGSGLFITALMIVWFGMDYKRAVAYTMTLCGIFWNATGAITLVALGEPVYWPWVPALLAGSFIGGYLGAHFGSLKGNRWIKIAFIAVTFVSGLSLLLK